jgi:hypothetical protein
MKPILILILSALYVEKAHGVDGLHNEAITLRIPC